MEADFIEEFVLDMEDLLTKLESSIMNIEKDKEDKEILNELFRVIHSVKGISAMMELKNMESLVHNMENLLFEVRDGKIAMSDEIINLLLICKDYLGSFLENLKTNRVTEETEGSFIHDTIKKINSMTKKSAKKKTKITTDKIIVVNSNTRENIKLDDKIYKVKVTIANNCQMKKMRAYLIFKECMNNYNIFSEIPAMSDLEDEESSFSENDIFFLINTDIDIETIKENIYKIGEIENIYIEEIKNIDEENSYIFKSEEIKPNQIKFSPMEFKKEFEKEIEIQNKDIEDKVLKKSSDLENLNHIFRNFHTIAGLGKMISKLEITSIAEETLKYIEIIKRELTYYSENDIKNFILNSTQLIKLILENSNSDAKESLSFKIEYHLNMLEIAIKRKELLNDEFFKGLIKEIDLVSNDEFEKILMIKSQYNKENEIEIIKESNQKIKTESKEEERLTQGEIRVGVVKIEKLNELIGELQMVHSIVEEKCSKIFSEISGDIYKMNKLAKEMQNIAVSMNNLTLQPLYQKMGRVFRDSLKKTGKKAELITLGEDIEIERVVLEKITEPMIHIIKNCLSHGIEDSIERINQGKEEIGKVKIEGQLRNNNIYIEISDDGRGINLDRVFQKGVECGIATKNRNEYSNDEIISFLFSPGFSTAEKVDEMAGRGVGMDVVKSEIDKLHGNIEIKSIEGVGTTVKLKIPVNSMVVNGMVVEIEEKKYIIPTQYIKEISDIERVNNINVRGNEKYIKLRDTIIEYADTTILAKNIANNKKVLIIVESEGVKKVIGVDKIVERRDVTVTSLNFDVQGRVPFIGAAILGNGRVYLILDIEYIIK